MRASVQSYNLNSTSTCHCHFAAFIEERAKGLQFFINNILNHSAISKRYYIYLVFYIFGKCMNE